MVVVVVVYWRANLQYMFSCQPREASVCEGERCYFPDRNPRGRHVHPCVKASYRDTSFIRNCFLLELYSWIMSRALWWP